MHTSDIQENLAYDRADGAAHWPRVKVTRIWETDTGTAVAFDIYGTDWRGKPLVTHSAMSADRFADAYRPDAAAAAILYATPEDAANAARLGPRDRVVTIEVEYTRAKVGRWHYDGKVSRVDGGTPAFAYRDRQGRQRTTDRFTLVS